MTKYDQVQQSTTKYDKVRPSTAKHNQARPRMTKHDQARPSMTKYDQVTTSTTKVADDPNTIYCKFFETLILSNTILLFKALFSKICSLKEEFV